MGSFTVIRCEGRANAESAVVAMEKAAGTSMAAEAAAVRVARRIRKCCAMACPGAVVKGGQESTLFTIAQGNALLKC